MYDNVGMKVGQHIYENVRELRDATPDLILAVKPKVPAEEQQVTNQDTRTPVQLFLGFVSSLILISARPVSSQEPSLMVTKLQ